jgi:hypothetical protein
MDDNGCLGPPVCSSGVKSAWSELISCDWQLEAGSSLLTESVTRQLDFTRRDFSFFNSSASNLQLKTSAVLAEKKNRISGILARQSQIFAQ